MTTQEVIDELNSLKIMQKELELDENFNDDLYEKYFNPYETLKEDIDIEEHRHYELSTSVIKLNNEHIVGVEHISKLYSDMSSCEDIYYTLEFFPVEEVQAITYRRIKNK